MTEEDRIMRLSEEQAIAEMTATLEMGLGAPRTEVTC